MPAPATFGLPTPPDDLTPDASLFLDFDGTLVEIAARPDAVRVDDRLRTLIAAVADRLEGRLAIVSGRAIDDILSCLALGATPGFAIAGSHGLELLFPDGHRETPEAPADLAATLAELDELAASHPGLLIEEKAYGAAIHYRQAPKALEAVETLARRIARRGTFTLQHGKMVCELRVAGADKGDAVTAMLARAPMIGTRPVFVGDDLTDEAGFRAARGASGAAILVGKRADSAADYALPDVAAVHLWLGHIADKGLA